MNGCVRVVIIVKLKGIFNYISKASLGLMNYCTQGEQGHERREIVLVTIECNVWI